MADKVTGTNKLLTYAAVADMIAVNKSTLCQHMYELSFTFLIKSIEIW